ncbi:hypothetical protein Tco_1350299 [Tanacetum coccineum]
MVYTGDDGQEVFVSNAWRRLFEIRAPLVQEFILEFFSTYRIGSEIGFAYCRGDDRGQIWGILVRERGRAPKKVTATDIFHLRSIDRGAANVSYLLAQYLFRHVEGKKSDARLSGEHLIRCLTHHFGLANAVAGAPGATEDALAVDEGAQANPAPQLPPPPRAAGRTMP